MAVCAVASLLGALASWTAYKRIDSATNRPRLTILSGPVTIDSIKKSGMLSIDIVRSNLGKFPATNVRCFRYDEVTAKQEASPGAYQEFNCDRLIPPKSEGNWGGETIVQGTHQLTSDEIKALDDGKEWATFGVKITYADDSGREHAAEFCTMFTLRPDFDLCPWQTVND